MMRIVQRLFNVPLLLEEEHKHIYVRLCLLDKLSFAQLGKVLEWAMRYEANPSEIPLISLDSIPTACLETPKFNNLPRKARRRAGFVYLMKRGKMYKIGRTRSSVEQRRGDLTRAAGIEITVIGSAFYADYIKAERIFHDRYASKRGIGEWFNLTKSDVTEILADFEGDQNECR